jgi:hypothetical protein
MPGAVMTGALLSYGALVGFFLVPTVIALVVMRSTVVDRVESWLDGPCPDCGAGRGVSCHVACSTFWD